MDLFEMFESATPNDHIGPDYIRNKQEIAVPYLLLLSLATLIGSVGNVCVIGAVLVEKRLRTNGNVFIVNLAMADLCVTAFVNPFTILGIVEGEVWFSDKFYLCEAIGCVCLTSCFCSLHSIGAISFNRFIHICHYDLYNRIFTFKASVVMAMVLWVECFLMTMPNFIGWGDFVYDRKNLGCVWDRTADFSYSLFFSSAGVAFPVSLIAICYLKIYLYVQKSKRRIEAIIEENMMSTSERNHSMRLARTLFVIFVIFTMCWTPYAIVVSADVDDSWPLEVHIFAILLAHSNSSINCVLYGLTNAEFRRGYLKFFKYTKCGAYVYNKIFKPCRSNHRKTKRHDRDIMTITLNRVTTKQTSNTTNAHHLAKPSERHTEKLGMDK